jgi:RimJ/RimL family protein N-acetyltransferase
VTTIIMAGKAAELEFVPLQAVDADELLICLNHQDIRTHLVEHPLFTPESLQQWLEGKEQLQQQHQNSRIRAVVIDNRVAGWCGIQPQQDGYELAIVIARPYWGVGPVIFRMLMAWARELGHRQIEFLLLDSRRRYRLLEQRALAVHNQSWMGRSFTRYVLSCDGD